MFTTANCIFHFLSFTVRFGDVKFPGVIDFNRANNSDYKIGITTSSLFISDLTFHSKKKFFLAVLKSTSFEFWVRRNTPGENRRDVDSATHFAMSLCRIALAYTPIALFTSHLSVLFRFLPNAGRARTRTGQEPDAVRTALCRCSRPQQLLPS